MLAVFVGAPGPQAPPRKFCANATVAGGESRRTVDLVLNSAKPTDRRLVNRS
jgi:hypothetical protein